MAVRAIGSVDAGVEQAALNRCQPWSEAWGFGRGGSLIEQHQQITLPEWMYEKMCTKSLPVRVLPWASTVHHVLFDLSIPTRIHPWSTNKTSLPKYL